MRITKRTSVPGRGLAALAIVLAGGGVAAFFRQSPPIAEAAPATTSEPDTLTSQHTALHIRYAEARLRLAVADLEKALDLVRVQPGQVAESELRGLRNRVQVLQNHVEATRRQPHGNSFDLSQASARAAADQADDELGLARLANTRRPNAVSPHTLRQLEARADIAHARLALWEDPAFLKSPLQVMQMQIDQLTDQVLELTHRADSAPTIDWR